MTNSVLSTGLDLQALRNKINESKKQGGGQTKFQPHKLEDDTTVNVRFLPLKDNSSWRVDHTYHKVPGDQSGKMYTCPETIGGKCPFCERSRGFFKEKNDTMGLKYWKKHRYYSEVVVRPTKDIPNFDDMVMPILWSYGKKIESKLVAGLEDDEIGIFFEPVGGYDLKLKKKTVKDYANYDDSEFARKESDLAKTEDEMVEILERRQDLSKLVPDPLSYEELKALMDGASTAAMSQPAFSDSDDSDDSGAPVVDKPAKLSKKTEASDDDAVQNEVEALLAKIQDASE